MARPKRGNFATGEAGLARYKEALRKYLAKTKKTEVKKTEVKKPVAKKPVAKKPATKKPAAKKPVAKKPPVKKPVAKKPPVKKPVAKKPASSLKIKKAANTTRQALKKAAPEVKKAVKTVAKKAGEAKKTVTKKASQLKQVLKKGKAPAPKTPQQKAVSKVYRGTKKYAKTALKKSGKDLLKIGKGILKNPKSAAKGVLGGLATAAAGKIINRRVDSVFAKRKGMSVDEYRAARSKALQGKTVKPKTKSKESSVSKNIKKQKKANTTPSSGLKIKKTQYSSNAAKKKQNFGGATGTKKADKRFATFREGSRENRKLQQERQKGNKETYSRKISKKAEKTKATTAKSSSKKMHAIEKRNRKIFGDAHVDRLKAKHAEWKKRRKKK